MLSLVCDYAIYGCACALTTKPAPAIWEYFITFANEVDIFWTKPVSAPSMLFIATRWNMLATALLQIAPTTEATFGFMLLLRTSDANMSLSNCKALTWAVQVLFVAQFIGTARKHAHFTATSLLCSMARVHYYTVFSAIRVFAIWQRSYTWPCIILLLGIVPIATNLVSFSSFSLLDSPAYCFLSTSIPSLSLAYCCGQVLLCAHLQT